jgi:hypothetical protein
MRTLGLIAATLGVVGAIAVGSAAPAAAWHGSPWAALTSFADTAGPITNPSRGDAFPCRFYRVSNSASLAIFAATQLGCLFSETREPRPEVQFRPGPQRSRAREDSSPDARLPVPSISCICGVLMRQLGDVHSNAL